MDHNATGAPRQGTTSGNSKDRGDDASSSPSAPAAAVVNIPPPIAINNSNSNSYAASAPPSNSSAASSASNQHRAATTQPHVNTASSSHRIDPVTVATGGGSGSNINGALQHQRTLTSTSSNVAPHTVLHHQPSMSSGGTAGGVLPHVEEELLNAALTIGFDGVTVAVDKHVALERVSGVVRGGCLTGIVSCCGARGDYVLLNVLAGNEECGSGTVLANGTPVFAPAFRRSSVLIDDDFTTMDDLTVRQNLQFASSMRVASLDSDSVDTIIELLNLEAVEGKAVGRCNLFTRRRVALGKELLLRPKAIFFDQPVQGLATHEARQFLQLLRRVARKRVVVVSLVQPRWVLLELMDDVILLEGRHIAFSGTSSELLSTLRVDSEHIPDSALTSIYRIASSPECSLVDSFKRHMLTSSAASAAAAVVSPSSSSTPAASALSRADPTRVVQLFFQLCAEGRINFNAVTQVRPRSVVQFFYLVQYSLYQIRNNLVIYSTLFAVVLILSIILAAIYSSQSGQSGMQNRIGMIFFLVSSTMLHNMLFVESRRREFLSFLKHRSHGYYGSALYLFFIVTSSAFVRFFSSAIFTIVVYSLGNIGSDWAYVNLRDLVAVVALTSYSTNLLVYFVSSVARTARIAHFVLFALYTFDVILAGIILNVNTLPRPFQVVSLTSHIRLGYESAVITQFVGQDFGCVKGGGINGTTESCYTGDEYLSFLGFSADRKWANVELLLLLSAVTILAQYLVLVFYKPPRKVY